MKKILMVLAVAAAVLAVSACKNGSKAAEENCTCAEKCDSCCCQNAAQDTTVATDTVAAEAEAAVKAE